MEVIIAFVAGVLISWGATYFFRESDEMLRQNLEDEIGKSLFKAYKAEKLNIELRGLLRSLLNKVNKVTSNHLHGLNVTGDHLDALVDRQHEVEATLEELGE